MTNDNLTPLTLFHDLKWRRLCFTFLCKKTTSEMKSHPVSVFQAIIKAVSSRTPAFSSLKNDDLPVFHIKDKKHSFKMNPLASIRVDFYFFKQNREEITHWRQNLVEYLSNPVYNETVEILTAGEVEDQNYAGLAKELENLPSEGELCLEFLSPLPFNREKGKTWVFISKDRFIKLFEKRFSLLFGREITYEFGEDDFSVLPYYWKYTEIKHSSRSQQGNTQYINGAIGKLYIKGTWKNFIPFLVLGAEIHTGIKLANSQGYYRILPGAVSYFEGSFPDVKEIISVTRDVIETYDHAAEWLSGNEMYPFDEKTFAEKLVEEIKNNGYEPSPNTAFVLRRENKKDRVVEQMNFKDLIVSRYLVKTIYKVFDNIFEEESIGSRKGIPGERAVEMVKTAGEEGYEYLIESGIEEFFPSVDLEQLHRLLDFYLPAQETVIRSLLKKITGNGYILDSKFHERMKGLALGNPLSSCLANLYLDSFDGDIKSMDVRVIRCEDDVMIFCKNREEAEGAAPQPSLHGPWFSFFENSVSNICFFEVLVRGGNLFQKESLYIDEAGVFVGLMGNMIFVKKGQEIINVIPLRRVDRIEIRGDSIVSAGLLRRCKERGIPLAIRLIGGYIFPVLGKE